MASLSWLNDNQFRDYPFMLRVDPLSNTIGLASLSSEAVLFNLPQSAVLDFGAIMDIDAGFDDAEGHTVYLYSVSRFDDVLTFRFRTTAANALNTELVFSRSVDAAEFEISHEDASSIESMPMLEWSCPSNPKWSGFIVTGRLQELADLLTDGETAYITDGLWCIEPARIQNLARAYLRSITVANAARVMATVPAYCSESAGNTDDEVVVNAYCMTGNIKFKEGFNCSIRQDNNNNAIIISAGVGVGEGVPCEEIPLYDEEVPPEGSSFLSGGLGCRDVVMSINGITGTNITLIPGPGFKIEPHAVDPSTLVVDRSLDDFAYCHGVDTNSSISSDE